MKTTTGDSTPAPIATESRSAPTVRVLHGNNMDVLPTLEPGSVHCCITSPPYWGLRSYLAPDDDLKQKEIGLEATPEAYVASMVAVFREVKRVLRDDGTLWMNLGDSYWAGKGQNGSSKARRTADERGYTQPCGTVMMDTRPQDGKHDTIKPKDLVGIPWRVAFALQADGWYLRSDIIWHKPNPMPESVTDRPTKSHEYLFLLTKSERYYYDAEAIKEESTGQTGAAANWAREAKDTLHPGQGYKQHRAERIPTEQNGTRNKRTVWTVPSAHFSGAHFATFPPNLITPCILAGCPVQCCPTCGKGWERDTERIPSGYDGSKYGEAACNATGGAISGGTAKSTLGSSNGKLTAQTRTIGFRPACDCGETATIPGTVLDPFGGSGTTGMVAYEHGRSAVLVELSKEYAKLIDQRLTTTGGLCLSA